jgi:hypothetical protein
LLASALVLSGCKQGVGDRCQTNDDCDSNLTCIIPSGSALTGGTCQPANADLGVTGMDSGAAADLTVSNDLTATATDLNPPD